MLTLCNEPSASMFFLGRHQHKQIDDLWGNTEDLTGIKHVSLTRCWPACGAKLIRGPSFGGEGPAHRHARGAMLPCGFISVGDHESVKGGSHGEAWLNKPSRMASDDPIATVKPTVKSIVSDQKLLLLLFCSRLCCRCQGRLHDCIRRNRPDRTGHMLGRPA